MASGVYNFQNSARARTACERGITFRRKLTLLGPDNLPVNIAGYSVRMQVRDQKQAKLLELTTENGRIEVNGLLGEIVLSLGATITETLPAGIFNYDIELVASADNVTRLLEGKFQVSGDITR